MNKHESVEKVKVTLSLGIVVSASIAVASCAWLAAVSYTNMSNKIDYYSSRSVNIDEMQVWIDAMRECNPHDKIPPFPRSRIAESNKSNANVACK